MKTALQQNCNRLAWLIYICHQILKRTGDLNTCHKTWPPKGLESKSWHSYQQWLHFYSLLRKYILWFSTENLLQWHTLGKLLCARPYKELCSTLFQQHARIALLLLTAPHSHIWNNQPNTDHEVTSMFFSLLPTAQNLMCVCGVGGTACRVLVIQPQEKSTRKNWT